MIKIIYKLGIERKYPNKIKVIIHDKPTTRITLNGENQKGFPQRAEIREGCSLSPLLFNVVLAVQAKEIGQESK